MMVIIKLSGSCGDGTSSIKILLGTNLSILDIIPYPIKLPMTSDWYVRGSQVYI